MQHRLAMQRTAESNKCERCGRRSAIVWIGSNFYCRWIDDKKCDNTGNL